MAKSLIITEKPSVAQEFARILGVSGRNDGYIENDKYVITWCVGHLVEKVYPEEYDEKYKRWRLEDLPFLPEEYKYNVIPNVSKQYDTVHRMLFREDIETVYWAGDAGKEGQTIEENIRRTGASNIRTKVWDALEEDVSMKEQADIVLADLPCSGLGIIGRKPDIKYRMTKESCGELAKLQREILSVVWNYVKPGGTLVFSTCTIDKMENEDNRAWFLEHFPFEAADISAAMKGAFLEETLKEGYIQLLPAYHNSDGFFLSVFRRKD